MTSGSSGRGRRRREALPAGRCRLGETLDGGVLESARGRVRRAHAQDPRGEASHPDELIRHSCFVATATNPWWADPLAMTGQIPWATSGQSRWPPTGSSNWPLGVGHGDDRGECVSGAWDSRCRVSDDCRVLVGPSPGCATIITERVPTPPCVRWQQRSEPLSLVVRGRSTTRTIDPPHKTAASITPYMGDTPIR